MAPRQQHHFDSISIAPCLSRRPPVQLILPPSFNPPLLRAIERPSLSLAKKYRAFPKLLAFPISAYPAPAITFLAPTHFLALQGHKAFCGLPIMGLTVSTGPAFHPPAPGLATLSGPIAPHCVSTISAASPQKSRTVPAASGTPEPAPTLPGSGTDSPWKETARAAPGSSTATASE